MADQTDFPGSNFPTVFVDGITSIAQGAGIVKFYLYRNDPSFSGNGSSSTQSVAQVIMPMDSFAATFAFFENVIQAYISQGHITASRLDELRTIIKKINAGAA